MGVSNGLAPVKVLIADDSSFMRAALSRMVESDSALCVIGTAETGLETLAKISTLQPDVITLDIDMPGLSGLETLRRVMAEAPRPVIIVSSTARHGAQDTLLALELGAFDVIAKQLSYESADVLKVQNELVSKIKAAAGRRGRARGQDRRLAAAVGERASAAGERFSTTVERASVERAPAARVVVPTVIAIGASTGGPNALLDILSNLPGDLPASVLIVQHMPVGFTGPLAERLNDLCPLTVREAEEGVTLARGHVYLAPAGKNLTVRRRAVGTAAGTTSSVKSACDSEVFLRLSILPSNLPHIPSVDVMMTSVAEVFGTTAMGIILTGMGDDGTLGMQAILREGGLTLGQSEASCVVYGMPRSCAEMGLLHQVVALPNIAGHILSALRYRKPN